MARKLDNWIEGFMFFTSENESPDTYFYWIALSTLAAAVRRNVFVRWGHYNYYPNLYVILVGPPAKTHKSSSIRHSTRLLRDAGIPRGSEAITKEALIAHMIEAELEDQCAITVHPGELGTFLDASGPAMIEFLTDIYDSPDVWEYRTRGRGIEEIKAPYLNLLAGTTPSWISENFTNAFIDGGFASRTIFIVEEGPRFLKARPQITAEHLHIWDLLVEDLIHLCHLKGEFEWSPDAETWFDSWYEQEWNKQQLDYKLESYLGRKPTHILKLSMLLALAESDELVITSAHMRRARQLLEIVEPMMPRAFSAVGKNRLAQDIERIRKDIYTLGGMSYSAIRKRNYSAVDKEETDRILLDLIMMGTIKQETRGNERWYVPND